MCAKRCVYQGKTEIVQMLARPSLLSSLLHPNGTKINGKGSLRTSTDNQDKCSFIVDEI